MTLSGRTAVVTGGASGMGLAISQRLAQDGASIGVFDVNSAGADQLVKQLQAEGTSAIAVEVDVSDRSQVDQAVGAVHDALGPVHILVNSAGIAPFEAFEAITEESWDRVIAVNLKGVFNCTQAVIRDMVDAGWGRIVHISSSGAQSGSPMQTHYVASKAALFGFTKALALAYGRSGITVNCVPPGTIDTPMLRGAVEGGLMGQRGSVEDIGPALPVGRVGKPEDIAAACAFLVSEEASYVTGQILGVNGGRYM
jgi:NAD(P)-dependent dehydrogenase (short-subunit alcohol dehydrogenase family)